MATSLIGKTRLRLQALALGVSGGGLTLAAGRVGLGYSRTLESSSFFARLLQDGPYLMIGTAALDYAVATSFGPAEIHAALYAGFDRGSANGLTAVDDLLENLRDAWSDPASYSGGEALPQRVGWKAWQVDPRPATGLVLVPLFVTIPDPPCESNKVAPATPLDTDAQMEPAPKGRRYFSFGHRPDRVFLETARHWLNGER